MKSQNLLRLHVFLIIVISTIGTSQAFGTLPESVTNFGMSIFETIQGLTRSMVAMLGLGSRALSTSTSQRSTSASQSTTEAPVAQQNTRIPVRQRPLQQRLQQQQQQQQDQQQAAPLLPQPQAQIQRQNIATFRPFIQMPVQQQQQPPQGNANGLIFSTGKPSFQQQQPNYNTNFQIPSNVTFVDTNVKSQNFDDDDDVQLQYAVKRLNGLIK